MNGPCRLTSELELNSWSPLGEMDAPTSECGREKHVLPNVDLASRSLRDFSEPNGPHGKTLRAEITL